MAFPRQGKAFLKAFKFILDRDQNCDSNFL